MVADPTEHYQSGWYEAEVPETYEHPVRLSLGQGAVRASFRNLEAIKPASNITLYEASFYPEYIAPEELAVAIDHTAGYAVEKKLLAPEEAEWWRQRLRGDEAPDSPKGYTLAGGGPTTQSYLLELLRRHPGDMNGEGPDRRRRAMAMKGLMQKFLGNPNTHPDRHATPMGITEIEEWVTTVNGDRHNMFFAVEPAHVRPMLAGGFDAVFRRAPNPPLARLIERE